MQKYEIKNRYGNHHNGIFIDNILKSPEHKLLKVIIYNIRMNFVINPSKDGSFNQILTCLWSFLSISAFAPIVFCNFAGIQS